MNITLNGEATVTQAATVEALVAEVGAPADGTAVAIDGDVVPRSQWQRPLREGCVADILTAVQGG